MKTRIRLNLSRHCIHTECKRLHNKTISAWFKAEEGPDRTRLENMIELLQQALSCLDFGYLRSGFSELSGNTDARVELGRDSDGRIKIIINGAKIDAAKP